MNLSQKSQDVYNQQLQEPQDKPKGKSRGLEVGKFEFSEDTLKLFVAKGFSTKKWVLEQEIPVLEVERIESEGNELAITWKGTQEWFHLKEKTGSFTELVDQVNGRLEEERKIQQQTAETNAKNVLRTNELLTVIDRSMGIVDLTFNLLIALQDKRINWQQIEAFAGEFREKLDFTGQTLPPLKVDYSLIGRAVRSQAAKDASTEAFNILKAAYMYFDGLRPEDDIKDNPPTFQTAKTLIHAYYLLNDLLLGRFVGDKNTVKENSELETSLQTLAEANFKVEFEALNGSIKVEGERQTIVNDSRAIFREQLKQLTAKPETVAQPEPASLEPPKAKEAPVEMQSEAPSEAPTGGSTETPKTEQPTMQTAVEPSLEPSEGPLIGSVAEPTAVEAGPSSEEVSAGEVVPAKEEPKRKKRSWFNWYRKPQDIRKDN